MARTWCELLLSSLLGFAGATATTAGAAVPPDQPTPEQIYTLALRLGTSYLATATHLVNLAMLGQAAYRRAVAVTPKWIKAQLGVHGPGDSWGDVWRIRQDGDASSATPQPGDEIVIELTEIPSTGYIWQLERSPHSVRAKWLELRDASLRGQPAGSPAVTAYVRRRFPAVALPEADTLDAAITAYPEARRQADVLLERVITLASRDAASLSARSRIHF